MIELPEAATLARQLGEALAGGIVSHAQAGASPHRFAWYSGDPAAYGARLTGRRVVGAVAHGGLVEIATDGPTLVLGEGAWPRLWPSHAAAPQKHQLLVDFEDGARLSVSVAMYGWIGLAEPGEEAEAHRGRAHAAPSPLGDDFDLRYWDSLLAGNEALRLKALLATEQRIPGLGNGVLQDILWSAGLHPRRPLGSLADDDRERLYESVRGVLAEMVRLGGRSTERDAHGAAGGYQVVMQRGTVGRPCPRCGGTVRKEQFLGGSVYACEGCQC
jgi:formamidopyrimidine-DNA glycosylase